MRDMKKRIKAYLVLGFVALWGVLIVHNNLDVLYGQANLKMPNVTQATTTSVKWTAGTLDNGGHAVTVTASSAGVTANRTTCAAPAYNQCNIVFANSGGTVSVSAASNALFTATQSGNTIMAYVETNGAGTITRIAYPQQVSTSFTAPAVVTECLASSTCAAPLTGLGVYVAQGSATLAAGTVTVTGISPAFSAFNATTLAPSYGCFAILNATTSGPGTTYSCVPVSGTSLTINDNSAAKVSTDKVRWFAISNSQ